MTLLRSRSRSRSRSLSRSRSEVAEEPELSLIILEGRSERSFSRLSEKKLDTLLRAFLIVIMWLLYLI